MIPQDRRSTTDVVGTILSPRDEYRRPLVDKARGGVDVGDTSQGIDYQDWRCWYDNGRVKVRGLTNGNMQTVITVPGLTELSFAFDRNTDPVVAYVQYGATKMYWYNSLVADYVTTTFNDAYSPRLVHDDFRDITNPVDDVLLFYVRHDFMVCYRQQRDRYDTEIEFAQFPENYRRISKVGMNEKLRLQVEVVQEQF